LNVAMTPPPTVTALETSVAYDVLGRVIQLTDPDLGTETRLYSGFGEIKRTTDANGGVTTISRDALGRSVTVETPANGHYPAQPSSGSAMRTTFDWDTAQSGVGQLASAASGDGISTVFTYDGFGRSKKTTWTSSGASFEFMQEYDSSGRVSRLHYPSPYASRPFVLRYDYGYTNSPRSIWDVSGTMAGAIPAEPPSLLWHRISTHGSGLIQEQQFGNTTRDTRRFDAGHQLRYVESKPTQGGSALQRLAYQWEGGLIKTKTDLSTQARETYGHDFLGRLSSWVVDQNCTQAEWRYHYDDWGNLRRRERVAGPGSDVISQYTTVSKLTHPHAVKELVENGVALAYAYKPGGQAEVVRGAKVDWRPFGLPASVSDGWGEAKYYYDAFNSRFRTSESATNWVRDVISIGGLFEQEISASSPVYKYSVHGPEGLVAQVRRDFATSLVNVVSFVHADHLGSPDTVTNASGAVVERVKHDPFGQRRHPWAIAHPVSESMVLDASLGFTGHVAGDRFGLTDMRGRVYDAAAGNFLSPDLFQHGGSMGLSRTAYVRNSPVMRLDPSGFTDEPVTPPEFPGEFRSVVRAPRPAKAEADPSSLTGEEGRIAVRPETNDQATPQNPQRDWGWFQALDKFEKRRALEEAGVSNARTVDGVELPPYNLVLRYDVDLTWAQFTAATQALSIVQAQAATPALGHSIDWFFRGAANDPKWLLASWRQKWLYDLGQTAVKNDLFAKLPQGTSFAAAVARGEALLERANGSWVKAFTQSSVPDAIRLAGTGPTPAFRIGSYVVLGSAGVAGGVCGVNQSCVSGAVDAIGTYWPLWSPGLTRQ
jgi:RHS repeat-associated protein